MDSSSIRHAVLIARVEWIRHRREFGGPWTGRSAGLLVLAAASLGIGGLAYSVGRELATNGAIAVGGLWIVPTLVFVPVVVRSSRLTYGRFEGMDSRPLLTAIPATAPALGLCGFVFARVAAVLALPTTGVALGVALGLRSPTAAITVVVAVAALSAIAVAVGTAGRLAVSLVGTRLVRAGFYRDLLVVFGWVPLLALWFVLRERSFSVAPLLAALESQPTAWFVDLALLGSGGTGVELSRALGALGAAVLAVPLFAGATTVLVRRIWERDPAGATEPRGSHALFGGGWFERLFGDRVSRPVLTVARARWHRARRVPYGLLSIGYVLLFVGVVLFPTFGILGVPGFLWLAVVLGLATGFAFGTDPIAVEYGGLPMLLTTIDGRQYVRGVLLAALAAGVPLVTAVVLPLGVVSAAGFAETVGIAVFGIAVCACTAAVALANGMGVDRSSLVPVPFFFTDVTVYGELGWRPFRRMGTTFAIVALAGLPASLGNTTAVYERIAVVGVPVVVVRVGALLVGTIVLVGVSSVACRIATRRYREYRIG